MEEYGRIGQKRYNGVINEEFLSELRGKKGLEVYREMAENDDVIGAILYAIEMLIRQCTWNVEPCSRNEADIECAEFVESCMHDMSDTWVDTISEILSFLTFGWSYHEIVYKKRKGQSKNVSESSKYNDGLIGWSKIPIRAQETLYEWKYDDNDNLIGMIQSPPPDFPMLFIPIEKSILFRTKNRKGNPEGKSILRNAYRSWYFKRRIQEIEGIGIERDLAGLPVMTAPEGLDIWNTDDELASSIRAGLETMVKGIRRDEVDGVVLPNGFKLELLSSGGSRQFDTNAIIDRYDTRMAMTVLADFLFLGHQQTGSFALSSDKTELFAMACGAYLDIICQCFNSQAIPRLIALNSLKFGGITGYPILTHGDIEKDDISKISMFIKDMTNVGILVPDETLEDYVRQVGNLPKKIDYETDNPNVMGGRDVSENKTY